MTKSLRNSTCAESNHIRVETHLGLLSWPLQWAVQLPLQKKAHPPPKKSYVHVLIRKTCEYDRIWGKGLGRCNYIKNPEVRRPSWIIHLGSEPKGKCLSKGHQRDLRQTEERRMQAAQEEAAWPWRGVEGCGRVLRAPGSHRTMEPPGAPRGWGSAVLWLRA